MGGGAQSRFTEDPCLPGEGTQDWSLRWFQLHPESQGYQVHLHPAVGPVRHRCLFSVCQGSHCAGCSSWGTLRPPLPWQVLTSFLGPCKKPLTFPPRPQAGLPGELCGKCGSQPHCMQGALRWPWDSDVWPPRGVTESLSWSPVPLIRPPHQHFPSSEVSFIRLP